MKSFKSIMWVVVTLLVGAILLFKGIDFVSNLDKETTAIEQQFAQAAKEIITDLGNNKAKIAGPNSFKKINGFGQKQWLLLSGLRAKGNKQYAFKIYELPQPNKLMNLVVVPGFFNNKTSGFEDYYGYHIEIFKDQLFNPNILNYNYYRGYKTEPHYSTFKLLQKFFEKQKNK